MTLRAPSRRFLYNPGCRVETLLVSKEVMGFLAERVYSFHRLRRSPSLEEGGLWVSPVKASGLAVDCI